METGVEAALGGEPSVAASRQFEREWLTASRAGEYSSEPGGSVTERLFDLACLTLLVVVQIAWFTLLVYGAYRVGVFRIIR